MPAKTNQSNGVRRRWAMVAGVVTIVGVFLGTLTWVYSDRMAVEDGIDGNTVKAVKLEGIIKSHGKDLDDHEVRIRSVEGVLRDVARDVSWIRDSLEGNP